MWIFLPSGLVMPVEVEAYEDVPEHTLGYRTLQVRGRLTEHLEQFIADFMDPYGLDHSVVVQTPTHDYTCRFYTTKEAFATALGHAVQDIDYRHFKEQAERKNDKGGFRYKMARHYHNTLISLWSASLKLAPAGGIYGPRTKDNPHGYGTRSDHWYDDGEITNGRLYSSDDSPWWDSDTPLDLDDSSEAEDAAKRIEEIMDFLDGYPVAEWDGLLTQEERDLVDHLITPIMLEQHQKSGRRSRKSRARPESAAGGMKIKKMLRHRYSKVVVEVGLVEVAKSTKPEFDVYLNDLYLGRIFSYHGSLTSKIKGTRQVRRGKRRIFWSASEAGNTSRNYWMYGESQAAAIRYLLGKHESQSS